jgi:DNA-binding NtrC family response regulator
MNHAVLIVDDEPKIFHALRRALHREPYELLYAESGEQALALLTERAVDVVVVDENMPNMKGSALLARIRQQWPDVVRMMLTGQARLETVVAAVNRGEIFRFFLKPANEAELIVSLREALRMRDLKHEAGRLLGEFKRRQGAQEPRGGEQSPAERETVRSVIQLDDQEIPEDVEQLLEDIRTELKHLDR